MQLTQKNEHRKTCLSLDKTTKPWFSHLVWHLARQQSGPILTILEPGTGCWITHEG